jgi:hypothetical protein
LFQPSVPLGQVRTAVGFLFFDGLFVCAYGIFKIKRHRSVFVSGIVLAVFAQVINWSDIPQRQAEIFLREFQAGIQANGGVASLERRRVTWTNDAIKTLSNRDIPEEIARVFPNQSGSLTVIGAEYCKGQRNCGFIQFYLSGYLWGVKFGCCPEQLYPGTTIKSISVTNDILVYASRIRI